MLGLAARYRPRRFSELVGQRHVSAILRRSIARESFPQQLLLSGGSGLGKTTVARISAAALLCEKPLSERADADACGECENCLDVTLPGRTHPDVVEFDAASHGGKDEIREIAARAALSPLRATRKVYIIDEAHGLSNPGGQAFLKLLEEPPPHVVFILCTTDPQKMLRTNRGRCVELELVRPSSAELCANLTRVAAGEGWVLPTWVGELVVEATSPELGVRGTLNTLEKIVPLLAAGDELEPHALRSLLGVADSALITEVTDAVLAGDRARALRELDRARALSSDAAVRAALIDWTSGRLRSSSADAMDRWVYSLELLLDAAAGPAWTDLVTVKITQPHLDDSPEAVRALIAAAQERLATLAELGAGVHAGAPVQHVDLVEVPPDLYNSSKLDGIFDAEVEPEPALAVGLASSDGSSGDETTVSPFTAASEAGASAPTAEETEAAQRAAQRFLSAVEARSKRTGALARSAGVDVTVAAVVVHAPPALYRQLESAPAIVDLRAAAGVLGLPLQLVKS